MQYSIVNFRDIDLGDRIDSEYFEPKYLRYEAYLKKREAQPLKKYSKITASAFYPAATQLYEVGEIPFIRCVDCINFPIITEQQNSSFEKIPKFFIEDHKNVKRLKKNEIVITKVGTPCYASIIHEIEEVALSRTVLGLQKIVNINPFYLTIFLRSKYGFEQLSRERELTIQYQLTLDRVGKILIFKPKNKNLESIISSSFKSSLKKKALSKDLYDEAQNILLSELGLERWRPQHRLSFIKNFSDIVVSERFDAEYFQPIYDEVLDAVSLYSPVRLGDLVEYKKGIEPGSEAYKEDGIPFVRVSDVSIHGINRIEKYISKELAKSYGSRFSPKKGEILFTKDGTIGISFVVNNNIDSVLSGAFLRLRLKKENVEREYLALVLNSLIGKQQINKSYGGGLIAHLRPTEVMNLKIPILSSDKQKKISQKIINSRKALEESENIIEKAKKAIEIAIEKNEKEAINFLS